MSSFLRQFHPLDICWKKKNSTSKGIKITFLTNSFSLIDYFLYRIWKKTDFRKGGERNKWLNSPNVYQKVEILETGTPDPKKITKVEIIKFENKN